MSDKIKNTIIIAAVSLVTIPFVLITDIFPFMRFGMFAEPIKGNTQKELFIVTYLDKDQKEVVFNSENSGIQPHFFNYLVRNYYYKNQPDKLIDNISQIHPDVTIKEWRIKKIIFPVKAGGPPDTLLVFKKTS